MTEKKENPVSGKEHPVLTVHESGVTREVLLDRNKFTLGRNKDCGIVLMTAMCRVIMLN